jgi:isocitrate dehydrogenase
MIYTKVDEAPALASYALLPVVKAFAAACGIDVKTKDISLAGRIIANFPENLSDDQKINDDLALLGELAKTPEANIIKLPNISASIPQLQEAVKELNAKGYDIPAYPEEPKSDEDRDLVKRFAKVLGSAVNPVLREGNSDRRAAESVKKFGRKYPHKMMKPWPESGSKARVAHMTEHDFFGSEKSVTFADAGEVRIEFIAADGQTTLLKEAFPIEKDEIIDAAVMNVSSLRDYYAREIAQCQADGALLSLHLKATMMKVSDPILFGHCVSVFFKDVMDKYADELASVGVNVNHGLSDILDKIQNLDDAKQAEIRLAIEQVIETQPALAMVDSDTTNLHMPNKVIIDASVPNIVRDGGKMWDKDDQLRDTVALIPDRSYATMYQRVIEDCREHGQFDPSTMGSVSNVGLMAKKAEEYGSHDKTFEAPGAGEIAVIDQNGDKVITQPVETGDVFRMCQTKDIAVSNWVQLAVTRARATGDTTIFWLDELRGHDAEIIRKIDQYLPEHDTTGLDIQILAPQDAMGATCGLVRQGKDVISVTGNVLRDYLTDLFPILSLGTSARMLSVVPLINGGGLYETGAGGSAPKHVQQFVREGHLRWDSLGEYCALVPAFEQIATHDGNAQAQLLADALNDAISEYLENGKSPSRKVNELDNRGSSYYLTMYWAKAMSQQTADAALAGRFAPVAQAMIAQEAVINEQLLAAQGDPIDIGGYYLPDAAWTEASMRPSGALNEIVDGI